METTAITDAITEIQTVLATAGLGKVYDHIPAKAVYPSIIIAPTAPFIEDSETFSQRKLNLDIWVLASPTPDNRNLQQTLYSAIATAITSLETLDALEFEEVSQPTQVEFNQAKTLAAIITASVLI